VKKEHHTEFIKLYDPIHQQFCKYCRAISGNTVDSDDLIQETVLTVLENFDKIRDKSAFKPYMFRVACNLNKMRYRKGKCKAAFNELEIKNIIDFSQDQEYLTDFKLIYEQILSLPLKTSETLILFHISDLSLEDIQIIQGGSPSGVKLRLKRG